MSDQVTFTLYGKPQAKGRPRFTRTGRAYTDERTRQAEQSVLSAWLHEVGDRQPHEGAVTLEVVAAFAPPTSWPKWKREAALSGFLPHTGKPDLDNLLKIVDALNGRAWIDDSQVIKATVSKWYASVPYTRMTILFHPPHQKDTK